MSENDINRYVDEFAVEMKKILIEKLPKYQNTWKEVPFTTLRFNLMEQMKGLVLFEGFDNLSVKEKAEMLRIIYHVGNYTCLLAERLKGE